MTEFIMQDVYKRQAVDMEHAAKKYTKGISKEELNTFVNVIIKLCENADS